MLYVSREGPAVRVSPRPIIFLAEIFCIDQLTFTDEAKAAVLEEVVSSEPQAEEGELDLTGIDDDEIETKAKLWLRDNKDWLKEQKGWSSFDS